MDNFKPADKITPVVYGTLTMTLIAVIPVINLINIFCCAGIIAGGYVGVYSYWKQLQQSGQSLEIRDGGMIGILCGILSAVFVTGMGLLISLFSDVNPMIEVMNSFDEFGFAVPPEMLAYVEKFSNEYNEHGFSPTITIFSFIINIILYPLFGSAGAILGVSLLKRKNNNPQI